MTTTPIPTTTTTPTMILIFLITDLAPDPKNRTPRIFCLEIQIQIPNSIDNLVRHFCWSQGVRELERGTSKFNSLGFQIILATFTRTELVYLYDHTLVLFSVSPELIKLIKVFNTFKLTGTHLQTGLVYQQCNYQCYPCNLAARPFWCKL